MLVFILAVMISAVISLLGILAYNRRKSDIKAEHFSYLVAGLSAWLLFNQIGNSHLFEPEIRQVATYIDFIIGPLLGLLFFLFAHSFREVKLKPIKEIIVFAPLIVIYGFILSKQVILVSANSSGIEVAEQSLYWLYILLVIVYIAGAAYELIRSSLHSTAQTKSQLKLIYKGLIASAILFVIANFVLENIINDRQSALYLANVLTYLGVLTFVISSAAAIIRQRLFDIRLTAARTSAYTMSLITIIILYGGLIYLLGEKVFGETEVTRTVERFIFIVFAIITAAVFNPLRRFFDKFTNFIFYRDAYNTKDFLGELNNLLAQATNLDSLLLPSAKVIQSHMKLEYCTFGIKETATVPRRIVGTTKRSYKEEDIAELRQLTVKSAKQIISVDYLRTSPAKSVEEKALRRLLKRNNISVLARLADSSPEKREGQGYLLLGAKKSGNSFTSQDMEVLSIAVNSLVLGIQNALRFEEIEQFNETLQEKIYSATKELKSSNEKLKALDEAKDEFISMASHQLRTPLTSVKGYLSMLAEGDAGKLNPTQQKFVEQSFLSAQRMVYLISDLLNVSRLKTGKFVIERVPTYLPDVIEQEIAQLYETAAVKDIKFQYNKPKDFPSLQLDETKIRQVVMNLCDNAIYYTPNGGSVTLNLKDMSGHIEFSVTDTGLGVPKAEQHHLFTKFYRAGNARKVRPDGTGLGLFMAKKVVIAQGGGMIFRSTEGKGSTFGFSFPKNHKLLAPEAPK